VRARRRRPDPGRQSGLQPRGPGPVRGRTALLIQVDPMFTVRRIHLRLRIGDRESNRCLRSAFDADQPFPRMGPLSSSYATGRDESAGSSDSLLIGANPINCSGSPDSKASEITSRALWERGSRLLENSCDNGRHRG
jgi:hypothetical protein